MTARPFFISRAARRMASAVVAMGIGFAMVALVLLLPPAIYAFLTWRQFAFLKITAYVPHEDLFARLEGGAFWEIFTAPLVSANMTSGLLLANMFELTVGQFILSVALGLVMALALHTQIALRRLCRPRGFAPVAAASGTGLAVTIAASSTGILGCCGSAALGGGVLALLGVGSVVAGQFSIWSVYLQAAVILGFFGVFLRLHYRLRALDVARA